MQSQWGTSCQDVYISHKSAGHMPIRHYPALAASCLIRALALGDDLALMNLISSKIGQEGWKFNKL